MSIKALRILPPIAIGRLGSAADPLVAYEIEADPEHPLDIPRIKGAKTLVVDRDSGEIVDSFVPKVVSFKEECTVDGEAREQNPTRRPLPGGLGPGRRRPMGAPDPRSPGGERPDPRRSQLAGDSRQP